MCQRITFLVLCICILFTGARAQQSSYFVEKLSTEEGLSSNKINDLVQDDKGFLWIATSDGLNRFDGTEVTQFYYQQHTNSLPHNYIFCVKKMPGNYLAIGTQSGLSFYNGNNGMFENFYVQRNDAFDEYNNTIVKMEIDASGNLWAASRNCLYIFDKHRKLQKTIYSSFTEADATRERLKFVEKILPLSDGRVIVGLYDGWYTWSPGADRFTKLEQTPGNKQLEFLYEFSAPQVLVRTGHYFPYSHIFKVFGRYFLCIKPNVDSLVLFDEKGRNVSSCYFPYNKYPYVSWSHQVTMLDSTRLLFLFHNYGMAMIPISWQHDSPVIQNLSSPLFELNEYGGALRDRQGNWWLATTEEGLQKISPHKQYFKTIPLVSDSSGTPTKYSVVSVMRRDNKLWAATYGDGFFSYDLVTGRQQHHRLYKKENETIENFIWSIRQVSTDTLWLGTQAGMFWYHLPSKRYDRIQFPGKPSILDSVAITTQFEDSRGLVWIGLGKGKGLCYFDKRTHRFTHFPSNTPGGYPLRYPTAMTEDKKGNLWFVNDASTLLTQWERNSNRFQTFALPSSLQRQLSNLSGIWCDNDTILWLGSMTSGLIRYHVPTGSVIIYGHDKGLGNSHVSSIYKDHLDKLWLVTDGGLSSFDTRTKTFSNYSPTDGLPVKYSTAFFYYDSADNRLYNGGHGSLFYFDPGQLDTHLPPQNIMITSLVVNGKPFMLDAVGKMRFRAYENDITISYTSVDLVNGKDTRYAYKLVGEDTGWSMANRQRQINFSRLAPGHYTFMVRAINEHGDGSMEPASISFSIRPPFTQTAWFYGLILMAMAGLFYVLYRLRLKQVMRTEQMRSDISKNLHDEVGSALTNISLGSLLAQKQLAGDNGVHRILERIYQDSQEASASMREIVWSINPKIDTIGEAFPRMLHYASELLEAKNIELHVEMSAAIEQVKLSMQERRDMYLIFKEAVNNLAKYSNATKVKIQFQLPDQILTMIIADNGKGFDTSIPYTSNGLRNMQERAKNHQWTLRIESAPGAGTTITLKVQIA
jgi:signal transduction histidine kinase/ligand-binding sensor domain-containing protein